MQGANISEYRSTVFEYGAGGVSLSMCVLLSCGPTLQGKSLKLCVPQTKQLSDTPKTTPNDRVGEKKRTGKGKRWRDGRETKAREKKGLALGLSGTEQCLNIHAALWLPEHNQRFQREDEKKERKG